MTEFKATADTHVFEESCPWTWHRQGQCGLPHWYRPCWWSMRLRGPVAASGHVSRSEVKVWLWHLLILSCLIHQSFIITVLYNQPLWKLGVFTGSREAIKEMGLIPMMGRVTVSTSQSRGTCKTRAYLGHIPVDSDMRSFMWKCSVKSFTDERWHPTKKMVLVTSITGLLPVTLVALGAPIHSSSEVSASTRPLSNYPGTLLACTTDLDWL